MNDVTTRIRGLSADKRARLARLLQKKLEKSQNKQPLDGEYDVVILGGGLAGATLAIQLKQARPETSILVAEKRQHPVPEAAFKVGEYEDDLANNSRFDEGDWNGDGEFDSADLVAAFQAGTYVGRHGASDDCAKESNNELQ